MGTPLFKIFIMVIGYRIRSCHGGILLSLIILWGPAAVLE
jgi:hypothetical protein